MSEYFAFFLAALVVVILSAAGRNNKVKKPLLFDSDALMHAKLGAGQMFIVTLLLVSLFAISQRILYDLSRTIGGPDFHYYNDLRTIMAHAIFIVPVFVAFVLLSIFAGETKKKYALIFMPYFITTVLLAIQLIGEISIYFSNHHTTLELYVVLVCLAFITSYAIWYVQRLYNDKLEAMKTAASSMMQSDETAK